MSVIHLFDIFLFKCYIKSMNTATSMTDKSELNELKSEIRTLRKMLEKILILLGRDNLLKEDLTKIEILRNASRVFNVTSKKNKDDDNIANPKSIKPVDFSSYV